MKLKDEDIKEIARLIVEGWSYIKLACKFNMSKTNIDSLVRRYKMHRLEGILHTHPNSFSIEEKIAIINQYYSGESKSSLVIEINVKIAIRMILLILLHHHIHYHFLNQWFHLAL